MRIEYDQNYGYVSDAWKQYFQGSSCSAGAAGKRYFYHDKVWTNDIDHVCIDLLPMQNAQAVSTLIGLSGGNVISGDRLMNLAQSKTEILKKILPATIEQGKPVDLYDSDPQTVFACKIKRKFAEWDLVAFFNPDLIKSVNKKFSFDRLWLDSNKTYLCFDFWNEKFIGEISKNIDVTINPGSVVLYSLHEKVSFPIIISTNRHIKQGAVEIEDTYFDSEKNILHCTSVSPVGSSHSVFVYVPGPFGWIPENGKIYQYNKDFTIRSVDKNLLRVDLTFTDSDKKEWSIDFRKY